MANKRMALKLIFNLLGSCLISMAVAGASTTIDKRAILNAEYLIATLDGVERIRFQNGEYQRGSSVFQEGFLVAKLQHLKFSDLNNDGFQDVVAIAASNTGGSASWISLSGLLGGQKLVPLEPVFLGDRVVVSNISIEKGSRGSTQVCLDMLVHGPNDGMCCPTKKERRCFVLSERRWIPRK
ncbi:hypothetical protein ACVWZ1_002925 [Thermostichus sp. MS-CIW-25]